ncbi:MAG TPA: hypothetical protein VE221_00200 [Sphingomicrobium sp.]|nr:hypothetical protein [Sphingomicrobium sp.]
MRHAAGATAAAVLALAACNQTGSREPSSNAAQPANAGSEAPPPIPPPETGPDARTPLAEPKGTIDPKSVEAAGQVVQHYGALIEHNRFDEAAKLWGDAQAAAAFAKALHPSTHLEIGELGEAEGAAGSIYTTIPVVFYGDTFRRPANIILRRVNDVPGSTAEQRRWHIERIEWKTAN